MCNPFKSRHDPIRFLTMICGYHLLMHVTISIMCPVLYAISSNDGLQWASHVIYMSTHVTFFPLHCFALYNAFPSLTYTFIEDFTDKHLPE